MQATEDLSKRTTPLQAQIEDLGQLKDGWLDGEGRACTPALLERAGKFLNQLLVDADLPLPRLYPVPDGGISAEWDVANGEVLLTFDPTADRVELTAIVANKATREAAYAADGNGLSELKADLAPYFVV